VFFFIFTYTSNLVPKVPLYEKENGGGKIEKILQVPLSAVQMHDQKTKKTKKTLKESKGSL